MDAWWEISSACDGRHLIMKTPFLGTFWICAQLPYNGASITKAGLFVVPVVTNNVTRMQLGMAVIYAKPKPGNGLAVRRVRQPNQSACALSRCDRGMGSQSDRHFSALHILQYGAQGLQIQCR
jgi:hypothetical protein